MSSFKILYIKRKILNIHINLILLSQIFASFSFLFFLFCISFVNYKNILQMINTINNLDLNVYTVVKATFF